MKVSLSLVLLFSCALTAQVASYPAGHGPGQGKHVVLIAGDDGEYHSEETLPQLAKILSQRHGFDSKVIFPLDPDGTINPHQNTHLAGLDVLKDADLLVLFMRWRDLPDSQMKMLIDYIQSGRPILAIRTGTHPFQLATSKTYARYSWNSKEPGWEGGFGAGCSARPGWRITASTVNRARGRSLRPELKIIQFCAASAAVKSGCPLKSTKSLFP